MAILSVAVRYQRHVEEMSSRSSAGLLLTLELVDGRVAEGGELGDREGRRHAEMGYGGLPEVGNL